MTRQLSLVIPAYNAAEYLRDNVDRALDYFARADIDGEVIVVDDGSTDGTAETVREHGRARTVRIRHGGKGAALRAGVSQARGTIVAFTDADLPYGLEALTLAVSYIDDRRFHAVVGDRTLPGSKFEPVGALRGFISTLASFAFRTLVTGGIYDTQCGFKVFQGDIARELFRLSRTDGFAIDVELIYLLLKYRLDIKRIAVQLERTAPSSVRVVRDSATAMRDIGAIRLRWSSGRYQSALLSDILEREIREDLDAVARSTRDARSAPVTTPRRVAHDRETR